MTTGYKPLALVGFGEAGRAFATGWRTEMSFPVASYDKKIAIPADRHAMRAAWAAAQVDGHDTMAAALADAEIVICLVTADQARTAAEEAAPHLRPGTLWLDGNSCSPGTKKGSAPIIEGAGGRYVDVAVMAPVDQRGHRTPLLLSGSHAEAALADLTSRGMVARVVGDRVGEASSIKMIRSVMIKGFEALTAECLLAARKAGVEDEVLGSLRKSDPGLDWDHRAAYNLERMRHHGRRRASEMREVAATLDELGLPSRLATATVEWQSELAGIEASDDSLLQQLDAILQRVDRKR